MATDPDPGSADAVTRIVLSELAHGRDLYDITPDIGAHASERGLFPGDVPLDLAAGIHFDPARDRESAPPPRILRDPRHGGRADFLAIGPENA